MLEMRKAKIQDLQMLQSPGEETEGNSKCYCRLGKTA